MSVDFYIVRTDYYGQSWLYGMTYSLSDALNCIHSEGIHKPDTAIEFCRGSFPFNYDVYKTMFCKPQNRSRGFRHLNGGKI